MPLGGFAPLPLRLGGSATEGLVSPQHARLTADLIAIKRVQPLLVITYSKSGGTITIEYYYAMNGVGSLFVPTAASLGTGQTQLTFSKNFTDAYGIVYPIQIRHGLGTVHNPTTAHMVTVDITSSNVVTVSTRRHDGGLGDTRVTLKLW